MSDLKSRVTGWEIFLAAMQQRFVEPFVNAFTTKQIERIPLEEIFAREEAKYQESIDRGEKTYDSLRDTIDETQQVLAARTKVLVEMREMLESLGSKVNQVQDPAGRQSLIVEVTAFAQALVAEEQNFERLQQDLRDMEQQSQDMKVQIEASRAGLDLKKVQNKLALSQGVVTDLVNNKNDMLEQAAGTRTTTESAMADMARQQVAKRHEEALKRDRSLKRSTTREREREVRISGDKRVNELLNEVMGENFAQTTTSTPATTQQETKTKGASA